ncbi:lipopolysaccharide biosynthesis protein [Arenimonas composti]|uniref:lipopolysaccharide biosynthesis protein n=1 Tax=Arenimonas composti TaxID=370776 RepID=UPI001377EA38|nr:oligosaccharide flippase family protein [Arenimonas composti]
MAVFVVLARLLAPEHFGLYGAFMAVLALSTALGAFRFELSFSLVDDDFELASVLVLVLCAAIVVGVLAGVATGAVVTFGGALLGQDATTIGRLEACFAVGFGTVTLVLGEVLAFLALRLARHQVVAGYSLLRPVLIGSIQLGGVVLDPDRPAAALVLGAVAGQALSLVVYGPVVLQTLRTRRKHVIEEAWSTARRYAYLMRTQAVQQVLSRIGLNALPIALPGFFGASVGGWYVVSNRILCTPSQVFGKVLRGVYFAEAASRTRARREVQTLHLSATVGVASAALLFFAPISIFSSEVLALAFGPQWVEAAPLMSLLAIFWWSAISNIPSSALISPLRLDSWYVRYEAGLLTTRIGSVLIGFLTQDPIVLVGIFSISGFAMNVLLIAKVRREVFRQDLR